MIKNILKQTIFEDVRNTNQTFTKHFHDTYTIGITSKGKFKSHHLNKSYLSYEKSTKVINPYEVHGGESNSWDYLNFYPNIVILSDIYEQIFFERKIPIFEKHIIEDIKLYEKFYKFFYLSYFTKNYMQIESAMIESLSYLIKNYASIGKEIFYFENKKIVKDSIEYINSMLYDNISLDDLAKNTNISKYHLLRTFKKYTGLSPHQYILNQRIINYKNTLLKKKEITAFDLGFCDQSHLIRNFKKIYGYSPKNLSNSNFILYKK